MERRSFQGWLYLKVQGIRPIAYQSGFHPERILFRPGGVNLHILRSAMCGDYFYTSAQPLASA